MFYAIYNALKANRIKQAFLPTSSLSAPEDGNQIRTRLIHIIWCETISRHITERKSNTSQIGSNLGIENENAQNFKEFAETRQS